MKEHDDLFCERCGKKLTEKTAVWLELNCATGRYAEWGATDWSGGPDSQGGFAFGKDCAEIVLREGGNLPFWKGR